MTKYIVDFIGHAELTVDADDELQAHDIAYSFVNELEWEAEVDDESIRPLKRP